MLRKILPATILLPVSHVASAQSLAGSEPPTVQIVDRNGVDLITGQITRPATSFGIGLAGHLTFSMNMSAGGYLVPGGTPTFQANVYMEPCVVEPQHPIACSQAIYADYGDAVEKFANGTSYGDLGGSFVRTSAEYAITRSDGSVWHFPLIGQSTSAQTLWKWGYISKIEKPDGTVLTYSPGIVSSNDGYAMTFGGPGYPSRFINTTVDPCDANGCSTFTQDWKGITVSSSGGVNYYTDAAGQKASTSISSSQQSSTNFTTTYSNISPSGVNYSWTMRPWYLQVSQTVNDGAVGISNLSGPYGAFSYSYTVNTYSQFASAQSVDSLGGKLSMARSGDYTYKVTDQDNRTTTYNAAIWSYNNTYAPVPLFLNSVSYPGGNGVTYQRDARQNVTEVDVTSSSGQVLKSTASFDLTCSNYKTCNKPNYVIDFNGNRTDYTYDSNSGLVATEMMPADANGVRATVTNVYEQLSSHYKATGGGTVTGSPIWRLASSSYCQTQASCSGQADQVVRTYTYNENLLPVTETVKLGNGTQLSVVTKSYDAVGNVVAVDGPLSGTADTTRYVYDDDRRLIAVMSPDPDGSGPLPVRVVKTIYNGDGAVVESDEGTATDQSDAALAAVTVTRKTLTTYDASGRRVEDAIVTSGGTGAVTQYSYDGVGRLQCTAVRMNPAAYGSLPSSACAQGPTGSYGADRITQNVYDAAGQVVQVLKGVGAMGTNSAGIADRTNSYTANGKLATTADANGNMTTMQYDGFDRLSETIFPTPGGGDYEAYAYDLNGNRISLRKRDGRTINYSYDALNRMASKSYPNGGARSVYYTYDLRGHMTGAYFDSLSGDGITNAYDGMDRIISSKIAMNGTSRALSYAYDADGNRTKITYPDGVSFAATYDAADHLLQMLDPANAGIVVRAYDGLGRRTSDFAGFETYGYDGASRLTSQNIGFFSGNFNVSWGLGYNPADQIVSETRSNDAYAYTGSVNVSRAYAVNSLNQYTKGGPATYSYDANGNLTSDGATTYSYDVENRLISASSGVALAYDPLGRLWQTSGGSAGITQFLYDGDALVAEYNASGSMLRRYVHGQDAGDDPLVWYEGSGVAGATRRSLVADHQGSIDLIFDGSINLIGINSYDEYGIPASTNIGRFQYTGQAWLPELGMYYYKARIYSPTLGRFLQTDPIGYTDNINLYAYVANDPVNHSDPTGMVCDKGGTICTSDVAPKSTTTVENTPAMDKGMHDNAGNVRVSSSGTTEKIGFIQGDKNGVETFRNPSDAKAGSNSTSDTAKATAQPGDIAVIHGHIPDRSEGMQDDTKGGRSLGDAQALTKGLTNGTVLGNRLGVHELVSGVLQFRMIDGKMSGQERRDMQRNLDAEQRIFP